MRAGVSMLGSCAATRFGVRRIPARARKLPQRTVNGAYTANQEELNKERRGAGADWRGCACFSARRATRGRPPLLAGPPSAGSVSAKASTHMVAPRRQSRAGEAAPPRRGEEREDHKAGSTTRRSARADSERGSCVGGGWPRLRAAQVCETGSAHLIHTRARCQGRPVCGWCSAGPTRDGSGSAGSQMRLPF